MGIAEKRNRIIFQVKKNGHFKGRAIIDYFPPAVCGCSLGEQGTSPFFSQDSSFKINRVRKNGLRHNRGRASARTKLLYRAIRKLYYRRKAAGTRYSSSSWQAWRVTLREPLFATPCCNTSRATWSTPSELPHKKPFFEVLSFSAVFGTGCCRQLVYFEFGVLHSVCPCIHYPKRAGWRIFEVLSFSAVFGTGCCCQLVYFEFGVLHFRLPLYTLPETGRLENTYSWWFLPLVLAGCCCQLVCFKFVVLHFRLPIPETGRL